MYPSINVIHLPLFYILFSNNHRTLKVLKTFLMNSGMIFIRLYNDITLDISEGKFNRKKCDTDIIRRRLVARIRFPCAEETNKTFGHCENNN